VRFHRSGEQSLASGIGFLSAQDPLRAPYIRTSYNSVKAKFAEYSFHALV
jgi:hypothetical protein